MAVTADELVDVLENPERIKVDMLPSYSVYTRGKLALPVADDGTVVTVLWNYAVTNGRWRRDDLSLCRDLEQKHKNKEGR